MMINVLLVDDETRSREILAKMLNTFCPDVQIVAEASSVKEAIPLIEGYKPDAVFLDIEMPEGNGFTLLEHYPDAKFEVIFTTAHDIYAINAIKFAALDYLLKPVNIKELQEAVERIKKKLSINQQGENREKIEVLNAYLNNEKQFSKIAIPTSEGIEFVELEDIISVQADRSYANFFLKDGKKIMVSKPLKEYESILEQSNFFRVHKSYMINLDHIERYVKGKGGYVVMKDGSHVDVSVRRKEALLRVLTNQ